MLLPHQPADASQFKTRCALDVSTPAAASRSSSRATLRAAIVAGGPGLLLAEAEGGGGPIREANGTMSMSEGLSKSQTLAVLRIPIKNQRRRVFGRPKCDVQQMR